MAIRTQSVMQFNFNYTQIPGTVDIFNGISCYRPSAYNLSYQFLFTPNDGKRHSSAICFRFQKSTKKNLDKLKNLSIELLVMKKKSLCSDHPTTVKKRFLSVSVVMLISPFFVYYLLCYGQTTNVSIWEIMGFRTSGIALAIIVPFLLTATLFLGSICLLALNGSLITYAQPSYWVESVQNILWQRNHIVAPLSEEFTFRACMMPLLLQSFSPKTAIFLTPLFFGVAHLHHNIERVRSGMDVKTAIIVSSKSIISCSSAIRTPNQFASNHSIPSAHLQVSNLPIREYSAFIQRTYLQEVAILSHHLSHTHFAITWDSPTFRRC